MTLTLTIGILGIIIAIYVSVEQIWHTTPEHSKAASRVSKANKENVTNNPKSEIMKKSLIPIALAFALIAVAPAAFAGSAPGTLTVTASVAANCTISAARRGFGAY